MIPGLAGSLHVKALTDHSIELFVKFPVSFQQGERHSGLLIIQGLTSDGRIFRPSDWADRLAGVMSPFRPGGAQTDSHLSYSPWCVPTSVEGIKSIVVHPDLRQAEPMAWDFVFNFARDNDLKVFCAEQDKSTRP